MPTPIIIPDELKKLPLRYGLLQGKLPPSTEVGWEYCNNFSHDSSTLLNWLKVGWNYSVLGGFGGATFVDSDDKIFTDYMDSKAPNTFTVKSRRGKHWYFICLKGYENRNLKNKVGEVRVKGRYVVGPGSIHPETKQPYEIINNTPIAVVTPEQLDNLLKDWIVISPETTFDPFFVPSPPLELPQDDFIKYLNELIPQKCVLQQNLKTAPSHSARVAFGAWLNFLQMRLDEAQVIVDKLAEFAQWEDRQNVTTRHYQIRNVISKGYKPYSCLKLQKEGWCIGEKCPMFKSGGK
jgi:hypothetical protein